MPTMPGVQSEKVLPPFPTRQMTILALCRICEPIAFMSIFPYVYFMVKDFQVKGMKKSEIATYAGMVTSAFAFAEFSSGVIWGKLSDRIGRKPVLLTGLVGTALSMILFGFSSSFPMALVARALGGLLNGNIGVLQTTVAEMITVKEHQPRAYTIMPFVWCLGSILGPMLGGALARPVVSYPSIFTQDTIWARYPYLLPNLVCTVIVSCGVVVGILFLEETHSEKKYHRDPGLEAGKWILSKFARRSDSRASKSDMLAVHETLSLMTEEHQPPGYRSVEGSPRIPSTPSPEPQDLIDLNPLAPRVVIKSKPATTRAFTRQVVLNIIGYGILAYHTMTMDSMLPTLLSSKDSSPDTNLPFKFVVSYGLTTKQIGVILSVQGAYSMFATAVLFPLVVRKLGALSLFRLLALSYPIVYIATPFIGLLPGCLKIAGVYFIVIWKCTFATMAYPANAILLTNSAPSLLMLGTINGVAASTASLARTFGPTVSGFLFSRGVKLGYSGLAWWCSALIAMIGSVISLKMSDKGGRMDVEDEKADPEEAVGFQEDLLDHHDLDLALSAAESQHHE